MTKQNPADEEPTDTCNRKEPRFRGIMTRRLSSRSHTEDSIFLKPEEDPVWLDEPTKTEKLGDRAPKTDELLDCKDRPTGCQRPHGEEMFVVSVYNVVIEIHCWVALFIISQVMVCKSVMEKPCFHIIIDMVMFDNRILIQH